MSATGIDAFDTTIQKTHIWLDDLMQELCFQDRQIAYLAMRATLHALRDRLTVDEVAQLAAQLPMLVRGFYYEGWDPSGKPLRDRRKEQFLERIEREFFGADRLGSERVARCRLRGPREAHQRGRDRGHPARVAGRVAGSLAGEMMNGSGSYRRPPPDAQAPTAR